MDDKRFYFGVFSLSTVLYLLLFSLLSLMSAQWFAVHMLIIPAFLIVTAVGVFGLANKREWSTGLFLVSFAAFAIDGLYIISQLKIFRVYMSIALAIVGLFYVVNNMNLYKKKDVVKEIVRQAELLQEAEKSVREILGIKKESKKKTTTKKVAKTKAAKKAPAKKKATKKKVAKKTVAKKKSAKKAPAKKKAAKKSSKKKATKKTSKKK